MITRRQLLALAALTLMWGVNWPMMKLSLREITPLYFRALTMSGGALWLLLFYRWRGVRMAVPPGEWRSVLLLASTNMLGWHWLSILGVNELASGRASILGFTMPIWTVLIGVVVLGEPLTRRIAFAAVAAAVAVGLLVSHEIGSMSGRPMGIVWMEGGAILWATGTLMMRRVRTTLPVEALTVWMMIVSATCLWLIAAVGEPVPPLRVSPLLLGCLAFGMFVNYGFAQIIWFGMARSLPPATSAMSIMAVPLLGTLSATVIVGERPSWEDWVAAVFVVAAIAAVLLPARQPRQ